MDPYELHLSLEEERRTDALTKEEQEEADYWEWFYSEAAWD